MEKESGFYEFSGYCLSLDEGVLYRDGAAITLTQKSVELLRYLVKNSGRVVTKQELLSAVWADTFVDDSTLTSHIYMLRKAMKIEGEEEPCIRTIPKKGYLFAGEVKEVRAGGEQSKNISLPAVSRVSNIKPAPPAAAFDSVRGFALRNAVVASVLVMALLVSAGLFVVAAYRDSGSGRINSIAVLPFRQINIEKEDKMGLGMADILINQLGRMGNLRVAPTSAIAQFDGDAPQDPFAIGKQLGVDAVLTASSQCDNGVARVSFQLYDIRNNQIIISDMFDEKHDDVFPMQDRITGRIFERLAAELMDRKAADIH